MVTLAEKVDRLAELAAARTDENAVSAGRLMRTIRTRAYLSKAGHIRFDEVLRQQALLYNAALEERSTAWKRHQKSISFFDQSKSLTQVRADFPDFEGAIDRRVQVGTLKRLDKAYQAFFRRLKGGEAPGHPRFKSSLHWKTLEIYSGASRYVRYDAERGRGVVRIKGLPLLRFKDKRLPEGIQPLEIRISRRPNGVYLYFMFDHLRAKPIVEVPEAPVGINAGLSGVRWALSDGTLIDRRRPDNKRKRRLQRKIARQRLGSNSRRKTVSLLGKLSDREKVRNRNELHRIAARLIEKYDHFVVEDLDIKGLTASAKGTVEEPGTEVRKKAAINRGMLEQNWGEFAQMLEYKAEGASIKLLRVDPSHTSLTCNACGVVKEVTTDHERFATRFRCSSCGADSLATVNAARNILARGLALSTSSAGESVIAGRASVNEPKSGLPDLRPENHTPIRTNDTAPT